MALSSKIIGGLAWTGLALILAIPSADIVSSQLTPKDTLSIAADTDQIQTASISDPVERYEQTGKPLPSYISDAPAATETAAPAPKPTVKILPPAGSTQSPVTVTMPTTPGATTGETEVAAITPMAPVPYPASMRPKGPVTGAPTTWVPAFGDPVVVDEPVIVEEQEVAALPTVDEPPVRRPPAAVEEPRYITEDELSEWNSGNLADYLAEQGLLENGNSRRPSSTAEYNPDGEYDSDGFFLDEGPNNNRSFRSRSRRNDNGFFVVFPD